MSQSEDQRFLVGAFLISQSFLFTPLLQFWLYVDLGIYLFYLSISEFGYGY